MTDETIRGRLAALDQIEQSDQIELSDLRFLLAHIGGLELALADAKREHKPAITIGVPSISALMRGLMVDAGCAVLIPDSQLMNESFKRDVVFNLDPAAMDQDGCIRELCAWLSASRYRHLMYRHTGLFRAHDESSGWTADAATLPLLADEILNAPKGVNER